MGTLLASVAPRALNSGLWVLPLVNSYGQGFANGGTPGLVPYPFSKANAGPGQVDPTPSPGACLAMPTLCGLCVID